MEVQVVVTKVEEVIYLESIFKVKMPSIVGFLQALGSNVVAIETKEVYASPRLLHVVLRVEMDFFAREQHLD